MAFDWYKLVWRVVNKAGTSFVEPRAEDGHGSEAVNPTFVNSVDAAGDPIDYATQTTQAAVLAELQTQQKDALTDAQLRAAPVPVDTGLTTQTDALTDTELRASPVGVDTGLTQPTTPSDTQPVSAAALPLPTGAATAANQLPDNHNVTVSNFPAIQIVDGTVTSDKGAGWVDPQTDALTDAELRASPIAVENLTQLVPEQYDDIELGYTGLDLTTVTYRSGGIVVATLTLTYTLGQLTRVVRS